MKSTKKYYLFIFCFILFGCQNNQSDCLPKIAAYGNTKVKVEGCIIKGLEEGEWKFYNETNNLSEKGLFVKGIRDGKWHYPNNKSDSVIEWKKFTKSSNNLNFNIPSGLEVVEEDSIFVKFSNADSTKLFNLVLTFGDFDSTFRIEKYHLEAKREIIERGWKFSSKRQQLVSENDTFYYDEYAIIVTNQDSAKLISIYAIIGDKFFELTSKYPVSISTSANIIFFSVLSNIFHGQTRIFDPFSRVMGIKVLREN